MINNYTGDWYSPSRVLWMNRVVLENGRPVKGWVTNGAWYWRQKGEEEWACYSEASDNPVNSWPSLQDDWEKH